MAVNQRGEIIVGERGAYCVSIFSAMGEKIKSFGSRGSGHGQFKSVIGVALDDDGNIFVTDGRNHCIQKFTPDGQFIAAVGREGNKHLEFDCPRGIAVNTVNKKLYITDYFNHRLQILNPDLTFSGSFGSRGSGSGEFDAPSGVACDSTGNVYVTDSSNNCIQAFTAEGGFVHIINIILMANLDMSGFVRKMGEYGSGNGELDSPCGICIGNNPDMPVIYVTEWRNCRVSVFTCEGRFLRGNEPGQFRCLCGVTVDKNRVIYVCYSHMSNYRIQLF